MLASRTWSRLASRQLSPSSSLPCARCNFQQLRLASSRGPKSRLSKSGAQMDPEEKVKEVVHPVEPGASDAHLVRRYKPRTPGQRHLVRPVNDHLWKGGPHRPLTFPRKGQGIGGRNNSGKITVRHRGGGAKRRIRMVDTHRMAGGEHRVERIEYDPGRSAHIALVYSVENPNEKSYILAADGLREGDSVQSYRAGVPQSVIDAIGGAYDPALVSARITVRGNCMPLHMIPPGTSIFNIGLYKDGGGQLCRSAGTFGTMVNPPDVITGKYAKFVLVKLQSGEVRRIHRDACATVGVASNVNWHMRQLGKAGRSRNLGIRPTVRGVAMNAFEHPHGGGRGKSKGNRHPVSIWGRTLAKGGFKTRKRKNVNRAVVQPRPRNHGRRRRVVGTNTFER